MVRAVLVLNCLIMFLFWLACMVIIAPAHNHFIQYGTTGVLLPVPTRIAIDYRFVLLSIPVAWSIVSFWVFRSIRTKEKDAQAHILLFFSLVGMVIGFLLLIFYGTAGILPYLKIG